MGKNRKTHPDLFPLENPNRSTCTPLVLQRLQALALETSYLTSEKLLNQWGIVLSSSQIAELSQCFERTQQELCETKLLELANVPLTKTKIVPRVWMFEIDGMFIPTRGTPDDLTRGTPFKEVKNAVLYLKNTPSQRYQVSTLKDVTNFEPLVHGLLRFAGVTQSDLIVGLSDGAVWITNIMANLGVVIIGHCCARFQIVRPVRDRARGTWSRSWSRVRLWSEMDATALDHQKEPECPRV